MFNLLLKDIRIMIGKKTTIGRRLASASFVVFVFACFIGLEIYLFSGILSKISDIKGAPDAFLCVFLFIVTCFMTVTDLFTAKKLFFDAKDIEMLSVRPVTNGQIISSKLITLFATHYITAFMFVFPLLAVYGSRQNFSAMYFYKALFYPAASFLFEGGVALVLVYPLFILSKYLKNKPIVKLCIATVVMAAFTYFYAKALGLFTDLVVNNSIALIFTSERIESLIRFRTYALPVNFLMDIFVQKSGKAFLIYLLIGGGIFCLGLTITVFAYNYVRSINFTSKSRNRRKIKILDVTKSLIKKELTLIFRDSDYIFSFTGLLVVQPFLLTLVLKAMNAVFSGGTIRYYTAFLPAFVPCVDIFFIMIFSTTIAQGANSYISMEKQTVKNMKTVPVDYKTQLIVKVALPMTLSVTSLVISLAALTAAGVIGWVVLPFALICALVSLSAFDMASLVEELSIRHGKKRKNGFSTACSYGYPAAVAITGSLLSFAGLNVYLSLLVATAVAIAALAPICVNVKKRAGELFLGLEAEN